MVGSHLDGPGGGADSADPGCGGVGELPDHDASVCEIFVSICAHHGRHRPLTPALVLGLGDTARERGSVHVAVARIASGRGLADDELVQSDSVTGDLK